MVCRRCGSAKLSPNVGHFRVPEPLVTQIACPKCGAENLTDRHHRVWRVSDERGPHLECDCCGHEWYRPAD